MRDLPPFPVRTLQLADVIDLDKQQEWWDEKEVERHHAMMSDRHRQEVDARRRQGGLHVGTIFRRVRHGRQRAEVRFDGVAGCGRVIAG